MAEGDASADKPSSGGGGGWGGGFAVMIVIGVLVKIFGGGKSDKPVSPSAAPPPAITAPANYNPPPAYAPPVSVARLNVAGNDGTAELQQLAAGMTRGEAIALGLGVVLTGVDTYAARIRITNTGTVPVRVYPENLAVHFGSEAAGVTTINHPRFLQRGVLQPGYYFEGLVMYQARIDIGAAMRLAGGGLSYNDDTIQVTYNR